MKLLLISNSASPGESYLERSAQHLHDFLGSDDVRSKVLFVPYAGVTLSFDEYESKVNNALAPYRITVRGIHRHTDPVAAVWEAKAIFVGGGNTFRLVKMMQDNGVLRAIRERVREGMPYAGWSAGANVACPTLCTTNDMPIVEPQSFETLGLVPFQINPHYLDSHPANHGGETREQRIAEYLVANPDRYVVGLREGSRLLVNGEQITLFGEKSLRIFKHGSIARELLPSDDINFLLQV